jgi:DNA-binding NarL/FixJ family response regulator
MPPLLGDIVRESLARDPSVEVLAEVSAREQLGAVVDQTIADVAILGVAPSDWAGLGVTLRQLLVEHPRLTIIGIANDGRSGYVYQLQPRGVVINDISPRSLAHTIRSTVAPEDVHPPLHPFSAE